jgi:hypothetical protein
VDFQLTPEQQRLQNKGRELAADFATQIADEARKLRSDLKILFTTGYAQNAIIHQGRLDPGVQLIVKRARYPKLFAHSEVGASR